MALIFNFERTISINGKTPAKRFNVTESALKGCLNIQCSINDIGTRASSTCIGSLYKNTCRYQKPENLNITILFYLKTHPQKIKIWLAISNIAQYLHSNCSAIHTKEFVDHMRPYIQEVDKYLKDNNINEIILEEE